MELETWSDMCKKTHLAATRCPYPLGGW